MLTIKALLVIKLRIGKISSFDRMKLQDLLLQEHSKTQCLKIVQWIGRDRRRFGELVRLFLQPDKKIQQRAAWPLSYAVQAHPALIQPHIGKLIRNLEKAGLPDAVKRNTVRIFQEIRVPERFRGIMMNTCFQYISAPDEKPAVKAFSLTVLEQLAKDYPDIKPELQLIIEDRWDTESAAFRSRARKLLKKL